MSQKAEHAKHVVKTPPKPRGREGKGLDNMLLIRLVIAALIFIVAVIIKAPAILRVILLILSVIAAGYDVFLEAINSVEEGNYFATPLVVVFVTAIGFVVGYPTEAAALILLYQIGALALAYAEKRTRKSALDLARPQDEDIVARVSEIVQGKDAGTMELEGTMRSSAGLVLKLAMIFALVYAIVLPLVSDFTFRTSIHRALMIVLVSTPGSIVAAMPVTAIVGLCHAAGKGIVFHNAAAMEKAAAVNVVAFDKAGVFSESSPRVLSAQSDILDNETFMNFAAHAVYYSEQPLSKAIAAVYDQDYKLEVISDFTEIPGSGVALKIGGTPVVLALGEFFTSRGVSVPQDANDEGQVFYMTIGGRYIGKIVLSAEVNEANARLVDGMREIGVRRCVLLTEDSPEESQRIAEELGFTEARGEFDTVGKLACISELSKSKQNKVMYVYANGIESHSDADVDIRVSRKGKYADAVAVPEYVSNLPEAVQISRRVQQIARQNAIGAFIVKAVLIFLSITGLCTLWFAIFVDTAAAIATILNSIRVTNQAIPKSPKSDDEDDEDE